MAQYKLLHLKRDPEMAPEKDDAYLHATFGTVAEAMNMGLYEHVATLDALNENAIYIRTNSITESWSAKPENGAFSPEQRSTSVGDLIIDERDVMMSCQVVGWKEVPHALAQKLLEQIELHEPGGPEAPEEPEDDGPGF